MSIRLQITFLLVLLGGGILSAQNAQIFTETAVILEGNGNLLTYSGNLGTYSCTDNLSLKGFSAKTSACGSCSSESILMGFRVYKNGESAGDFSFINNSNKTISAGDAGCQYTQWENTTQNQNILSGLADGNYTIDIYFQLQGNGCSENDVETAHFYANFNVFTPIQFVVQPTLVSSVVCKKTNFELKAQVLGATNFIWQKKNGETWQSVASGNVPEDGMIVQLFSPISAPTTYRLLVQNCSGLNEAKSAEIEVLPKAPTFSVQPIDLTDCLGRDAYFKVISNATHYQWQINDNGTGFVNLNATSHYIDVLKTILKINNLLSGDHGDSFRCIVKDSDGCADTTNAATMFVNRKSTILAASSTICEGKSNQLTARSLFGTIEAYQWAVKNATGSYDDMVESETAVGVTNAVLSLSKIPRENGGYKVSMDFKNTTMTDDGLPQNGTCLLTETKSFTINPRPSSPSRKVATEHCGAGTISLTAPDAISEISNRWYADTMDVVLGTLATFSTTVSNSTSFFLGYVDTKSCESFRLEMPVTVHPIPEISVSNPSDICPTETSFLLPYTAKDADLYSLETSDFTPIIDATLSPSPLVIDLPANSASGTYHFTIKSQNSATQCFSASQDFDLKIAKATAIIDFPWKENTDTTLCEKSELLFSLTAEGEGILSYQWFKNDSEISGATESMYKKNSVELSDAGEYKCRIRGDCGEVFSSKINCLIQPGINITTQPENVKACENASAEFTIAATGENISAYVWKKNGEIVGENSATLRLSNVSVSDNNAQISCEILASCGTTSSQFAILTVIPLPQKPIVSETGFCQNATAIPLTATADLGNSLLWWGTEASGGVASPLSPTPTTATIGMSKYYVSQKTPEGCEGERAFISVQISTPFLVFISPSQLDICATGVLNTSAKLKAIPSNIALDYVYQWKKSSGIILGETTDSLTIHQAETYEIVVTAGYCSAIESQTISSILSELSEAPKASDQSVCYDETATFLATSSFSNGQFLWYQSDTSLDMFSSNNPLIINNVTSNHTYYVAYRKTKNFIECETPRTKVTLSVGENISISTQPKSITRCKTNTAKFSVEAFNATAFQWERQLPNLVFETIVGATAKDLNLSNIGNATNPHGTKFRVKVLNGSCWVYSEEAMLFVNSKDANLDSQTICMGNDVIFAVPATTGIISVYQWQKRTGSSGVWNDIFSENNATIALPSMTLLDDNSYYRCHLTFDNGDGSTCVITTDDARLTVKDIQLSLVSSSIKCNGDATGKITANATGGSSYLYQINDGVFQSSSIFDGLSAGNYSVLVKSSEGCMASENLILTEPEAILVQNLAIENSDCNGPNGSISFTASGGTGTLSFALNEDVFGSSSSFLSLSGGEYTLKIKDQNSCIFQQNVTVGGKAVPVLLSHPTNQTDCFGNSVQFAFSIQNAGTILWQKQIPNGNFETILNETSTILKVSNVGNTLNPTGTNYRVVLQNDGCEIISEEATLFVNSVSGTWGNPTLCIGATHEFDVNLLTIKGMIQSYQWSYRPNSSAAWTNLSNEVSAKLNLTNLQTTQTGYYRCRLTFDNGDGSTCTEYAITSTGTKLTVAESNAPLLTTDKAIVCDTVKATLSASGCTNGTVLWSNGSTGNSVKVNAGTYTASCERYGCVSPESNAIVITASVTPPTPSISTSKTQICENEAAIVIAIGCMSGSTVLWSNGETSNPIEVNLTSTLTAACVNECGQSQASNSIQITKILFPSAGKILASHTPNCVGYNPPEIENKISPTSGVDIQWEQKTKSTPWAVINGAMALTFNPSALSETTYYRRTVFNLCGMAISNEDSIVISPDPTISVLANNTQICPHETLQLTAQITGGAGVCSITWQRNKKSSAPTSTYWETLSETGQTIQIHDVSNTGKTDSTVFFRAVIDCEPSSCNKFTSLAIPVLIPPKIAVSLNFIDSTVCVGSLIRLKASGCAGILSWSNGETSETISMMPTTSETYTATCLGTCGTETASCHITVVTAGISSPENTTPTGVVLPSVLTFSATGTNLRWYASETESEYVTTAPSHSTVGTYSYWVSQNNGICESSRLRITASVYTPLAINSQPTAQYDCKGNGVNFSVNAQGAGTLHYQWQRKLPQSSDFIDLFEGESGVKNQQTATLKLSNVGSVAHPHLSEYRCVVSDSLGIATTSPATLYVSSLQGTFPNMGRCLGQKYEVDISEKFIITGEIAGYQWQTRTGTSGPWDDIVDNHRTTGSLSKRLIISNLINEDAAYFRCKVSFSTGGISCDETTDPSELTVSGFPPKPSDFSVAYCQFDKAKKLDYTVNKDNDVLWYLTENQTFGDTKAPTPVTDEAKTYFYYLSEITEQGCESEKGKITIEIHEEPKPPSNITPDFVSKPPLTFSAEGKNLKWFTSRTGKTYTTEAPAYIQPKTYSHYVSQTSDFGCESERTFITSTLRQSLVFLQQPSNQADCDGNSVTFSIKAEGWGDVTVQWERKRPNETDFSPLLNENSGKLTIKDVGSEENPDKTQYRCIIRDSEETLASDPAFLIVNSIEGSIPSVTICEGNFLKLEDKNLIINGLIKQFEWQKQEGRTWVSVDTVLNNWQNRGKADSAMRGDFRLKTVFFVDGKTTCNRYSKQTTISVNPLPKPLQLITHYEQCETSKFNLYDPSLSLNNTIFWYKNREDTVALSDIPKALISHTGKEGFFAVIKDNKGCESEKTAIEINLLSSPEKPKADSLFRYCLGAKIEKLEAKSPFQMLWFIGESDDALEDAPTPISTEIGTKNYYVSALDANGCLSTKQAISIEIEPCLLDVSSFSEENCIEIKLENVRGNKWFTFVDAKGNAYATLHPNGQNLGTVSLFFKGYAEIPKTTHSIELLPRYFDFQSSLINDFEKPVRLKLFFSKTELTEDISPRILHYEGINEDCSFENNDNFENGRSVVLYKNIVVENLYHYKAVSFETTSFSEFGISANTFSEIDTQIETTEQQQAIIRWNVKAANQAMTYGIQRSNDQKTWTDWQWISANGNTFEAWDTQPLDSLSYYRIVFRNLDGTFQYFDAILSQLPDNQVKCSVFPSPISSDSPIQLYVRGLCPKTIELLDEAGKNYGISSTAVMPSIYSVQVNSKLQAGVYFLRIIDREGNLCTVKFVSY